MRLLKEFRPAFHNPADIGELPPPVDAVDRRVHLLGQVGGRIHLGWGRAGKERPLHAGSHPSPILKTS